MESRAFETARHRCNVAWGLTALGWTLTAFTPNVIAVVGWGVAAVAWAIAWYAVEQV